MNTNRQDAIHDAKYILSLSETAFQQYLVHWRAVCEDDIGEVPLTDDDREYLLTLKEIAAKFGTPECLLREEE